MRLESWVERPLSVATQLSQGACGGHYMDACLIVSGLISGIASFVWPGTQGDRRRFIEAWVRFSSPDGEARRVSVPLLCRSWREHKLDEATASGACAHSSSRAASARGFFKATRLTGTRTLCSLSSRVFAVAFEREIVRAIADASLKDVAEVVLAEEARPLPRAGANHGV